MGANALALDYCFEIEVKGRHCMILPFANAGNVALMAINEQGIRYDHTRSEADNASRRKRFAANCKFVILIVVDVVCCGGRFSCHVTCSRNHLGLAQ